MNSRVAVMQALRSIKDPESEKDIVSLNFIADVKIEDANVTVQFRPGTMNSSLLDQFTAEIKRAVLEVDFHSYHLRKNILIKYPNVTFQYDSTCSQPAKQLNPTRKKTLVPVPLKIPSQISQTKSCWSLHCRFLLSQSQTCYRN